MSGGKYPALPGTVAVDTSQDVISYLRDEAICDVIKCGVPRLDEYPSYETFFSQFLLPNKPCVFSSSATLGWRSRSEWVCEDGRPNFEFLQQHFGEAVVPVADCNEQEFCAHPKQEMLLRDFLQYCVRNAVEGSSAGTSALEETPAGTSALEETPDGRSDSGGHSGEKCLYLKDWHFSRSFPNYSAYETPVFFQSDWLNEFWDTQEDATDDYKFVYMGPKHSWTPLHADVMKSHSWSANICGRKKWIFFPPGEEEALKDKFGQLIFDVTSSDLKNASKYPNFAKLQHQFEVFQEAGEIIFVPSGWHHQVVNLEDTISINHNWLNGCNIDVCWKFIKDNLKDVKREIMDCRSMEGWHQQCQLILKSSAGIDFGEFYTLLLLIAQHRMKCIGCLENSIVLDPHSLDENCSCNISTVNYTTDVNNSPADSTLAINKDNTTSQTAHPSLTDKTQNNVKTQHHCLDLLQGLSEADVNCDKLNSVHWRFCDKWHALFDLNRVKEIVLKMLQDKDWEKIDTSHLSVPPKILLDEITAILTKFVRTGQE